MPWHQHIIDGSASKQRSGSEPAVHTSKCVWRSRNDMTGVGVWCVVFPLYLELCMCALYLFLVPCTLHFVPRNPARTANTVGDNGERTTVLISSSVRVFVETFFQPNLHQQEHQQQIVWRVHAPPNDKFFRSTSSGHGANITKFCRSPQTKARTLATWVIKGKRTHDVITEQVTFP